MRTMTFSCGGSTRAISWWLVLIFSSVSYANIFLHNDINHNDFPLPNAPSEITLGAYYYPWHLRHFQVTREGYLRRALEPRQEIRLGEYDDTQAQVIQQHLDWSHQANIKVWISSWWGPLSDTDNAFKNVILPHPGLANYTHKVALLYETTGRIKKSEEYDPWRVDGDIDYICNDYVDHPNYFRINGRPVLVVYLTRLLENRGVLDIVMAKIRDKCPELYVIGDQVWGDPPDEALDQLDAVTNYDIYGNMGKPTFAGQSGVDSYYAKATTWKDHANLHSASFVPSVSPGYNDRGIRLQNDNPALSRSLTETSSEGSLLATQLVAAIQLLDPDADHLLLVNSFNEWHEDTQIEPCDGKPATNPSHLTQDLEYVGYGTLYLDILSHYTRPVDPPTVPENPIYYSGEPYVTANLAVFYYSWFTDEDYGRGLRANLLPTGQVLPAPITSDRIVQDLWISWQGNIKTWILPWNRQNHVTDSGATSVFSNPYLIGSSHQVALYYYVHFRVEDENYNGTFLDTSLVTSDIEHLCDNFLAHDRYYRTTSSNKPVLFMGLTRVVHKNGALEVVVNAIRDAALSKGLELFLVGDHIWGDVPVSTTYQPFSVLDAVINHDVYGNMGEPSRYAGQTALNAYYEQQRRWRIASWKQGCSYFPTVIPGYNDRAIRLSKNNPALSRRLEANDDEGTFFAESLDKAKHLLDSELDNMIVINSFNHFSEDTQIYPVIGSSTNLPSNLTQELIYDGYENVYMDLLAERFGSYPGPSEMPSISPSTSPRPSVLPTLFPSSSPSVKPSQSASPSDQPTPAPTVAIEIIDSENFESGMGIWNLGSDKESKRENRYVDALDPNLDPTFAVRLRKNKGVDSSFYTDVNVQDYTSLEIGFYFMFFDYDGDGFFLEYGVDGNNNNLNTLHYYQEGLDFHFPTDENKWFHQTVLLDVSEIQSVRISFRSAGKDKNAEVDIDYVNLTGRLVAVDPTENPSQAPSSSPSTASPSVTPSKAPSDTPSWRPSGAPSSAPTIPLPSAAPSRFPSSTPSLKLSKAPSSVPTNPLPSAAPSRSHSSMPSLKLSKAPSSVPTNPLPSAAPSLFPSSLPSAKPSKAPSAAPSAAPSRAPIAPSTWQRLNYEDFEQGMGIWREGGKEGKRDDRYVDALDPNLDPTFHVRLKKDKGESSSTYTSSINVESYTTIGVGFYFLADDMKGDRFYLEFALDGAAFTEVRDFQEGVDFDDSANTWYSYTGEDRIEMDVSSANQVVIRFRCAGSDKNSEVNIDHVSLWTKGATSGQDGILV